MVTSTTGSRSRTAGSEGYKISVDEYKHLPAAGFPGRARAGLAGGGRRAAGAHRGPDAGPPARAGAEMTERDPTDGGVTMQGLEAPPAHLSPSEKAEYFLRIHMLHRKLELHERYLLHPRVLDVLQALIGPDVLALQTMLFLKPPGKPGQGWHQDTYYIPTHPDSLCGAWIAIDDCDELNGAMWMATGSQHEPVYPPKQGSYGTATASSATSRTSAASATRTTARTTSPAIADRYPQLLVAAKAGDVVFFGGHVLHRSKRNFTTDRFRRSFVGHYCNARSFTQWGARRRSDPHRRRPDEDDQRLPHPGPRRHPPAVRPAPLRHPLRRPPAARGAPPGERVRRRHDGRHGQRRDGRQARRPRRGARSLRRRRLKSAVRRAQSLPHSAATDFRVFLGTGQRYSSAVGSRFRGNDRRSIADSPYCEHSLR